MLPTDYKNSKLTAERVREIFLYNYEDGSLTWRGPRPKYCGGPYLLGDPENPYLLVMVENRNFLAHRLIWLYVHGKWPEKEMIDHIDGNKSNNRLSNLRLATRAENRANATHLSRNNTSGHRGVFYRKDAKKNKWRAILSIFGKHKSLGSFLTKEEAKAAYDAAKREAYGEYASKI